MSRRLRNRRGSADISISVQESIDNSFLDRLTSLKQSLGRRRSSDNNAKSPATFVCYLNDVKEVDLEKNSETVSEVSMDKTESGNGIKKISSCTNDENIEAGLLDKSFVHLDDNLSLNTVDCNVDNNKNEIIYASVNWKSKERGFIEVKERFCCDICKTTFLSTTTDSVCLKS